ncbi:NmrA family NAD(P)-binding protein [Streptomyces luteolus]|uniref:NmrA family NAD(P)-binding protein n=1 Tax=Streptomyces luteolus TaxID=3043615 RepID=A0ABT6T873_9ACTN|nr:NmrA family NAD(P)-binding protein [Streptomyces sp. B-S-A12]MDI3424097.1 NmrA family NAD(P)-binding protein [Streptomyces sp. B-S-A12]
MFVILGANGQTGGAVARVLLQQDLPVRVVLRPGRDGREWASRGAEVAHADVHDAAALSDAFTGAQAAYVLNPPDYGSEDMLVSARSIAESYRTALDATGTRAVALSSIGAQHPEGTGNIVTTHILEQVLHTVGASFVRPGNFMPNWLPSLPAMRTGVLPSFFSPLDKPVPHAAVEDIARTVVRELQRPDSRTVELAAATDCSPNDVASAFSAGLGQPVTAQVIERDDWRQALSQWGLPEAALASWVELWEGFNTGYISFEGTPERGETTMNGFAQASVNQVEVNQVEVQQ